MSNAPRKNMTPEKASIGTPWPDQIWFDDAGEKITRPPQQESYIFGNPEWPIAPYREYIVDTVANNPVTVLSSGTGTGKSIFIPQALYESGRFRRVFITQPRIVATRENTQFIRFQMEHATGHDMGNIIGYRTATEGDEIKESHVIRQHTDGYSLQELMDDRSDIITKQDVFISDEAHERNANIDISIALALKKGIPLLIQSASFDSERTAKYASQVLGGVDVPVIHIPGAMHPVEQGIGGAMHDEIIKYANMNPENPLKILALVPGHRQIDEMIGRITRHVPPGYAILQLNGDQTIEEQRRAFADYPGGLIVIATEVARQSITIPGLDVVLDGSNQRVGDYRLGTRMLRMLPVSQAGVIQGAGRTGRTKPGIYKNTQMPGFPLIPRDSEGNMIIDRYDTPPIQRTDPLPYVLKLAQVGLRIDQIDLQDEPRQDELEYAHHKAVRLGAQVLNSVNLTEIGEAMQRMPLDPNYARMLVESRKYGKDIELMMAAMASVCQYDGITMTEQNMEQWKTLTNEDRSDMLVQLDVLVASMNMDAQTLQRYNIVEQRLVKARRLLERLCRDAGLDMADLRKPSNEDREKLIGCIIAGCDTLFIGRGNGYSNDAGFEGRLAKSTRINPGRAELVVGTPFILEHYRNEVLKSHSVIIHGTAVTAQQLMEHAPWRCDFTNDRLFVDNHGIVRMAQDLYFDGKAIHRSVERDAQPSKETTDALLKKLFYDDKPFYSDYDEKALAKVSPKIKAIYHEIERLRDLLIDRSNKSADYDWIIETLTQNISEWRDVRVTDMYSLVEILNKRKVHARLKITFDANSYETEAIIKNSPDHLLVDANGEVVEAKVTYKQNKAFIEMPTHLVRYLNPEEVLAELHGRHVYVWADGTKKNYLTLHKAIEKSASGNNRAARRAVKKNGQTDK